MNTHSFISIHTPFFRQAHVLLLVCLAFTLCTLTSVAAPDSISRAVLTVPTRPVDGAASPESISKLIFGVCKSGGTYSFADQMRLAGGEWRLIETPTAAHLVMLMPQPVSEAESILGTLLDQITAALKQPLERLPQPHIRELLLATAIGDYRDNEAKASLWLDGPLSDAQFRLESRLSTVMPGDSSTLTPLQDFIRYPGPNSAIARVLTWEPSTPDAHFSARYLGESFVNLSNLPKGTAAFDVWDFPTRTILVLISSAPIHEIDQRERVIDSFINDRCSLRKSDQRWTGFASASIELLSFDRRDLAKAALIAAEAKRNSWNLPDRPTISFVPPTSSRLIMIHPEETWNHFLIERDTRPEVVVANISSTLPRNREFVDAALLLKYSVASMPELKLSVNKLLADDSFSSMQLIEQTDEETLITWSMPFSELSSMLVAIRSDLSPFFQQEYSVASGASPASSTMHLALVGTVPPYRLLNRIHEAWPISPATATERIPLSSISLKKLLNAKTHEKQELRGRWLLCTSSQSGLARFLAKLAGAGISIRNLHDVETLVEF